MTARPQPVASGTASFPPWLESRFDQERARLMTLSPFAFGAEEVRGRIELHRNDYLRLGQHPAVVRARREADEQLGAVRGNDCPGASTTAQASLRSLLRASLRASDVVLTSSGWSANVGLLEALAYPGLPVYFDEESHGSLRDGASTAHARLIPIAHHDTAALEQLVARFGPGVVCIDAVNSTRGCRAPVEDYLAVCERYDCVLVLDESHAFGMMGCGAGGLAVERDCADRVHFRTMSFGKALGGHGGAIAIGGAHALRDARAAHYATAINQAIALRLHPVLFSSTTSPALAAGHERALRLAIAEPWRAERCVGLATRLRDALKARGVPAFGHASQIVSIAFDDLGACRMFEALRDRGVLGAVFLPPVIARGSLLRFTVHAESTAQDVDETIELLLALAGSGCSAPARA